MKNSTFFLIATLIALVSCRHSPAPKTGSPAEEGQSLSEALCYASKTRVLIDAEEHYNYEFIRLTFGDNNKVEGVTHVYNFGVDGLKGSIAGIYNKEEREVVSEATLLAEGERYKEARDYRLLDKAIDLGYLDNNNQPATLPRVACEEYDALFRESQLSRLQNQINTTDRTRLVKVKEIKARGYSQEELSNIQFLERPVDLDRDYETEEFLLYVIDPNYCGTGGCQLFVINEKGETLSAISAVKLPVFGLVPTIDDNQNNQGAWKALIAWSQGYRRLAYANGKYPDNASVEPIEGEELVMNHPEYYEVLLDYLNEGQ